MEKNATFAELVGMKAESSMPRAKVTESVNRMIMRVWLQEKPSPDRRNAFCDVASQESKLR